MDVDGLGAELTEWLGEPIEDLQRLSGGASRETWSLVAGGRPLILQRQRRGGGGTGPAPATEAAVLRAARASGVPVAEVVASDPHAEQCSAPSLVLERIDGETIARRILRDDEYAAAREQLAAQLGRAAAAVHTIDASAIDGLESHDQLRWFRELFDAFDEPHPAFELAFRWLDANRPAPTDDVLVHGDFRMGNLIVGPDGLRAVLDWELAHRGDRLEDLGWLCVRAWRFGGSRPVAGVGSYDELIAAYEAASGVAVDRSALVWWEVLGTLKWGVMCMIQASSHLTGAVRSVELATIGRRVCENEHDVLLHLAGPLGFAASSAAVAEPDSRSGAGVHGRPTASELIDAVKGYVEDDVFGATTGRVQFHARVAKNALAMVERELRLGASIDEAHRRRLDDLGMADDQELAGAIRSGALDDRTAEVGAAVWASVVDKLRVANPRYLN